METLVSIETPTVHEQILDQIMDTNLRDRDQSWKLLPDGCCRQLCSAKRAFNAHTYFMTNPSLSCLRGALKLSNPKMLKRLAKP